MVQFEGEFNLSKLSLVAKLLGSLVAKLLGGLVAKLLGVWWLTCWEFGG
jgi:hypothetical protein